MPAGAQSSSEGSGGVGEPGGVGAVTDGGSIGVQQCGRQHGRRLRPAHPDQQVDHIAQGRPLVSPVAAVPPMPDDLQEQAHRPGRIAVSGPCRGGGYQSNPGQVPLVESPGTVQRLAQQRISLFRVAVDQYLAADVEGQAATTGQDRRSARCCSSRACTDAWSSPL